MIKSPLKIACLIAVLVQLFGCQKVDDSKMFSLMPSSSTGITFKNILQETDRFNILTYGYLYNGGGVAVGDINNDGLQDLYFTGSMVGSHLYLNKGNFKFEDIAKSAGVFASGLWNTGVTMADVNADGLMDIYVCRAAAKDDYKRKNLLFINNGDLTFTESAEKYGIADAGYSTQAAFFDYDRDGDLDLYVLNHSLQEYASFRMAVNGLKERHNPYIEDHFYINDNGTYKLASNAKMGLESNVLGFGLGISVSDINNDGWPDIYIANDFNEQDYLYINNTNGTFTESLQKYIGHTSRFSMGTDAADINNDGYTDILTMDMLPEQLQKQKMVTGPDNYDKYLDLVNAGFYEQTMRNMLQLNNEGTSFSEIGQFAGVYATNWSWAGLFTDLDNDGYKDIFMTNGLKKDYTDMDYMDYAVHQKLEENRSGKPMSVQELLDNIPTNADENYTYRNNGDLTFSKMNQDWGLDQVSLSNGAVYADLDNDGDMDLVVNNTDGEAFVYRNNSNLHTQNHHLKITFRGNDQNRFGIGAKVKVYVQGQMQMQEMMPTRGFQSSVDYNLVFGLGKNAVVDSLVVQWPTFKQQRLAHVEADKEVVLNESEAESYRPKEKQPLGPYFVDITGDSLLPFAHTENEYVDFYHQKLLPHKLSTQGPKLAKGDVNRDGLEDLYLAGAKGSPGQLLLQRSNGSFGASNQNAFVADQESEDVGSLFFDADGDGDLDLYVVSGGNAVAPGASELQDRLYLNNGRGQFAKSVSGLPKMLSAGSCVAAADVDGDGSLDLFVGGRHVPGQYPRTPKSWLLHNDGKGHFSEVTPQAAPKLQNIGMVTDAVWADTDGDGDQDLMVVGEFMGITHFTNTNGKLEPSTDKNGLEGSEGWWNTIKAADMDGDGDLDFVVGNLGLNSQLKASAQKPVTLYAKDFDGNGTMDPILCTPIGGKDFPVFSRDDMLDALPMLQEKYPHYANYADQAITDIFTAAQLQDAQVLRAHSFATSYVENLGNGQFKISAMPTAAQLAPIDGVLLNDFNGDGNMDVLLAGNFYGERVKYGRYDADHGTLLLGDGQGNFKAQGPLESGLNIQGEVRDLAMVKNAQKGNTLIVARNNAPLTVYQPQKMKE